MNIRALNGFRGKARLFSDSQQRVESKQKALVTQSKIEWRQIAKNFLLKKSVACFLDKHLPFSSIHQMSCSCKCSHFNPSDLSVCILTVRNLEHMLPFILTPLVENDETIHWWWIRVEEGTGLGVKKKELTICYSSPPPDKSYYRNVCYYSNCSPWILDILSSTLLRIWHHFAKNYSIHSNCSLS